MVPPGDNLEFFEGETYKSRVKSSPELSGEIVAFLKCWPKAGREICPGIRLAKILVSGEEFGVFVRRKKNAMGLIYVFQLPQEEQAMNEREKLILSEFESGGNHE